MENLNKKLAVITPDRRGQSVCLDIGIPVMDLDRIEITEKRSLESVWGPKKIFDIVPQPIMSPPGELSEPEYPIEESLPVQSREEAEEGLPPKSPQEQEPPFPPVPEISSLFPEEFEEYKAYEQEEIRDITAVGRPKSPEIFEKDRKIAAFFQRLTPVNKVKSFSIKTKVLISFLAAALIVFSAALILVLPKAEINIETQKENLSFNFSLNAAESTPQLNLEKGLIPAQIIKVAKTQTNNDFSATGRKTLETKAAGKILVFNAYSSAPQTLVKNTRFVSKDDKLFRLTKTITVPGAVVEAAKIIPRSIEAEVIAAEVGEEYNIGPTTFTIPGFQSSPKYRGFYGESKTPMAGGAKGEVSVATRDDIEKAKTDVFKTLSDIVGRAFNEQVPANLKLIEGAKEIKVVEQTVSVQPDTPAQNFSVTMQISASAFLFNESDLRAFIHEAAIKKLPAEKEIVWDEEKIIYEKAQPDFSRKTMRLNVRAEETSRVKLDINQLKQSLAGKSQRELENFLSALPGLNKSTIKLWPSWTKSVPKNLDKIEIIIK